MKKIAIDTLPLTTGHAARGTGVYTRNIVESLDEQFKDDKKNEFDSFVFSDKKEELSKYDLIHYPYFDLFYHSLPIKKPTKTVVTVHDVTPLLYSEHYPPGLRGKLNFVLQKLALQNVDHIITISETSKKDIVRYLDIKPEKITPIYEAPNFKFKKQPVNDSMKTALKYKLPKEFVLYIGDVNWNKNLLNLAAAVKLAKKKLVIVGKQAVSEDYDKNHIENRPLYTLQTKYGDDPDILRLGYVPDSELNDIWNLATVYCLPSFYEGFGLSIVEAMDAGVPIACSRTQALVEVADEAALYLNPHDISDIADKITVLMKDDKLRQKLILNGQNRIKTFSWEKAAKATIAVYKQILEK